EDHHLSEAHVHDLPPGPQRVEGERRPILRLLTRQIQSPTRGSQILVARVSRRNYTALQYTERIHIIRNQTLRIIFSASSVCQPLYFDPVDALLGSESDRLHQWLGAQL